jgi:hypothetical protein
METKMSMSTYYFDVLDEDGRIVKHCEECFDNVSACCHAEDLLKIMPEAAAVYCVEMQGHAAYSAYRE